MITAIVMIACEADKIPEVAQAVADLDGVSEVYSVAGDVDLIAIVRVREFDAIAGVIAGRLSRSPASCTPTHTSRSAPTPGTTSSRRSASGSSNRCHAPSSPRNT